MFLNVVDYYRVILFSVTRQGVVEEMLDQQKILCNKLEKRIVTCKENNLPNDALIS